MLEALMEDHISRLCGLLMNYQLAENLSIAEMTELLESITESMRTENAKLSDHILYGRVQRDH
jgi:hypothetical protein